MIAGIAGIEGGHAIEESLERLEHFFEGGIRVMTLVWNNHLSWIRSCRDGAGPEVPLGLSDFGRDVVRKMNSLGMLVDLSHASDQAFYDTLEISSRPVVASHSGCRAVNNHPRNLSDEQLKALAVNGGVVGAVFCTPFLDAECAAALVRLRESEAHNSIDEGHEASTFFARALSEKALPAAYLGTAFAHLVECETESVSASRLTLGVLQCLRDAHGGEEAAQKAAKLEAFKEAERVRKPINVCSLVKLYLSRLLALSLTDVPHYHYGRHGER